MQEAACNVVKPIIIVYRRMGYDTMGRVYRDMITS